MEEITSTRPRFADGIVAHGRRTMRFPLDAEVIFWWWDREENYRKSVGRCRDVSIQGAYIFANTCPPVGTTVGLTMIVSTCSATGRPVRMETAGRVLRVDKSASGKPGFAVLGEEMIFVEGDQIKYEGNSNDISTRLAN
jgi:hypothetical protein